MITAIFDNQISTIDAELSSLQSRLTELKKAKKSLKAKQAKASKAMEALSGLASELAGEAIGNLKAAVLSIFPSHTKPAAPTPMQEGENFMVEVAKKMPTEEEIFDAECLPPAKPEAARATAPETEEKPAAPYLEFVNVQGNPTVGYFKKIADGEIGSIYLGCATRKLALAWAEMITFWGGNIEAIRDVKRLTSSKAKIEVKFKALGFSHIATLAKTHTTPETPVPTAAPPKSEIATDPVLPNKNGKAIGGAGSENCENGKSGSGEEVTEARNFHFLVPFDSSPLCPEWDAYTIAENGKPDKLIGRITKHLTKDDAYQHSLMRGVELHRTFFPDRQHAAADLLSRRNASQKLHDRTNAQMRAAAGF